MNFRCLFLLCLPVICTAQESVSEIRTLADRVIYLDESNTDSFKIYAGIIERASRKINYTRGLCDSYRLMGIYHECRAAYDQSIEWHLKNLELSEQIGDAESQLSALADLATQYHYLKQFDQAKRYLRQAILLGQQTNARPQKMSRFYMNLGVFYRESGQLDTALQFYNQSLAIKQQLGDSMGIANTMVNIGTLLIDQKKYSEAQPWIDQTLHYHQQTGDIVNLWFDYVNQAQVHIGERQYDKAEQLLYTAYQLAKIIESKQREADTWQHFATLYQAKGDYKRAFEAQKQYQQLHDEIFNLETGRKVAELQEKYEAEKRRQENRLLSLDIASQKSQKRNLAIIAVLIALLAGVALLAWWKNRQKRQELETEKSKLEQTLQRLHQMREQLIQAEKMATIGQLTAGIAHEINNPINFVGNSVQALEMNLSDLDQLLDTKIKKRPEYQTLYQEIRELLASVERGMDRTRDIVLGLRTFSRDESGEKSAMNLHDCIDGALALMAHEIKNRCVVDKHYKANPVIHGMPGKLNQVFLNLFANAIQAIQARFPDAVQPHGRISISTENIDQQVVIRITDNGIGMNEHTRKHIFDPFFTTKPVGEGTGLGMAICYGIIKQHGGDISVISTAGNGTTVEIMI